VFNNYDAPSARVSFSVMTAGVSYTEVFILEKYKTKGRKLHNEGSIICTLNEYYYDNQNRLNDEGGHVARIGQ
jgi:hypothetical protein